MFPSPLRAVVVDGFLRRRQCSMYYFRHRRRRHRHRHRRRRRRRRRCQCFRSFSIFVVVHRSPFVVRRSFVRSFVRLFVVGSSQSISEVSE